MMNMHSSRTNPDRAVVTRRLGARPRAMSADAHEDVIARVVDDAVARGSFVILESVVSTTRRALSTDDADALLLRFAQSVSRYARPPTSRFHVGAAARGTSGNVYLGVNVEISAVPLNHSIHAEQFALVTANANDECKLEAIATTDAPCGHCRQFMNELRDAPGLRCVTRKWRSPLAELLPHAFGPMDLLDDGETLLLEKSSVDASGMNPQFATLAYVHGEKSPPSDDLMPLTRLLERHGDDWNALAPLALEAMRKAYAPYSSSRAGIAIKASCGGTFVGWSMECAAYNPSMSPLQVVFARMVAHGKDLSSIERCLLLECPGAHVKYDCTVRLTLEKIAPKAAVIVANIGHENIA